MKTCIRCKLEKSIECFCLNKQTKDGRNRVCSKCYKEWKREYNKTSKYKEWVNKNREKMRQSRRNFLKTEKGKLYLYNRNLRRKKDNPEKVKAQYLVRLEIRYGRMKRLPCIKCGNPLSQGHHEDYTKPLDVIWLCSKHHNELHKRNTTMSINL